jgi:hypothetical protein
MHHLSKWNSQNLTNYSTNMCQSGQGTTIPRPDWYTLILTIWTNTGQNQQLKLAVPVSVLCVGLEKNKLLVTQTWM